MEYPYTELKDIQPFNVSPNEKPPYSIFQLARSALLSQRDRQTPKDISDIAQLVASKNIQFAAGRDERWERTLKDVLRSHYCFIPHIRQGYRLPSYICDPTIDPRLKKVQASKRKRSLDPRPSTTAIPLEDGTPSLQPQSKATTQARQPDHPVDTRVVPKKRRLTTSASFELETSDVYEVTSGAGAKDVWYCQRCGPVIVKRRRYDGYVKIRPLLKLVLLTEGATLKSKALKPLFGLDEEQDWPDCLPHQVVKKVIDGTTLAGPLTPILNETLQNIPNTMPLILPPRAPRKINCKYCGEAFPKRDLSLHHKRLKGTCQLSNGSRVHTYLRWLDDSVDSSDDSEKSDESDGRDTAFAQPFIGPAYTAWTEVELDRLFQGLRRFSRFRPEVIAEHVASKTALEVASLLEQLAHESALMDAYSAHSIPPPPPAAREMSHEWIAMEEKLAEDAIVWEAFISQAVRTPPLYRDHAQEAVTSGFTRCTCLNCAGTACDGTMPACGHCRRKGISCQWPLDIAKVAGKEREDVKQATSTTYLDLRRVESPPQMEAIHTEFLQDLSWHHLLSLAFTARTRHIKNRLEELWSNYLDRATADVDSLDITKCQNIDLSASQIKLRRRVANLFYRAGMQSMPVLELETLYQYIRAQSLKGNFSLPEVAQIQQLRTSPALARFSAEIHDATLRDAQANEARSQHLSVRRAARWREIPLSSVAGSSRLRNRLELEDILEEVQLASRQLKAVGVALSDLPKAGQLFNLRRLGILLDFYRKQDDAEAHISQAAVEELYAILRSFVTQLVASAVSMAESRILSTAPISNTSLEISVECVTEAIHQHQKKDSQSRLRPGKHVCDDIIRPVNKTQQEVSSSSQNTLLAENAGSRTGKLKSYQDPFKLEPLDLYTGDGPSADIIHSQSTDSSESDSEVNSFTDCNSHALGVAMDCQDAPEIDEKIEEQDKLEDHIYEEEMRQQLASGADHDFEDNLTSDDEAAAGRSAQELPGSAESTGSDSGLSEDDSLTEVVGMAIGSSHEDDNTSSEEESASHRFGRSASPSDLDGQDGRSAKRVKLSDRRKLDAPWYGPKAGYWKKPKPAFRSKEFISTSDEEDA